MVSRTGFIGSIENGKAAGALQGCEVKMQAKNENGEEQAGAGRELAPAARRALEEAAQRRLEMDARPPPPREINGRDGPDPVRYGDWEKKGLAVDF
jgi:hypothetical protein